MEKVFYVLIAASLLCLGCSKDNNPAASTTGTIQGQVTNPAGDSLVAGAAVSTTPPTSAATTDAQGRYTIQSVPTGQYTVTASKGGYDPGSSTITVSEGLTAIADIHLQTSVPGPAKSIVAVSISLGYTEGNMGMYGITDSTTYQNRMSIFSDNDIRTYEGAIYVLQRLGKDDIIKISGSIIADSKIAYDRNIGAAVNIQDIAFISSTKAYITQYQSAKVVIFDPSTGTKASKTIDLSAYNAYAGTDSAAAVPYMCKTLFYNGKVYVACQRLKAPAGSYLQAADTSCIVVIDAASDTVENAIKLVYKNPQEMSICNTRLYVASLGKYGFNDGGIECIDLVSGTNTGTIIDETFMQGDVGSLIVISDTKGYAVLSTASTSTELWAFNPQAKTLGLRISGIDVPCTNHFAYDGTYVYAGDRSATTPGIVVIDPATDAKVGATKNIGLQPNSLAYLEIN